MRRLTIVVAVCLAAPLGAQRTSLGPVDVVSPGKAIVLRVAQAADGDRLTWQLSLHGKPVIEPSPLGHCPSMT